MKRLLFVFLILVACFGQAFALPPDGTGGWDTLLLVFKPRRWV
jgi:hypothetical protein